MTAQTSPLINTKNPSGFALPGITLESRQVLQELLQANHDKFHIFFNKEQFHNHISHQMLAAAALGAQPDTLRQIYKIHSAYQRPQLPVKYEINDNNLLDFHLKEDAYSSYLAFFDEKLKTMTIHEAFLKYGTLDPIFDGLFGGLFHPLIHFCYGVEFENKLLASEGLAMAAVQNQDPGFGLADLDKLENLHIESKTIHEILDDIRNDPELNSLIKYNDARPFFPTTSPESNAMTLHHVSRPEASARTLHHVSHWHVAAEEQDTQAKMKELYVAVVELYAGSQRHGKKYQLDFYIMHFLTSVYFVYVLTQTLEPKLQAKVLKAHFAKVTQWFITRGSPKVDRSVVYNHQTSLPAHENPWFEIWDKAIKSMDLHVVKTVRALSKADELYADDEDLFYAKAAQITVETITTADPIDTAWSFKPAGFGESWE